VSSQVSTAGEQADSDSSQDDRHAAPAAASAVPLPTAWSAAKARSPIRSVHRCRVPVLSIASRPDLLRGVLILDRVLILGLC